MAVFTKDYFTIQKYCLTTLTLLERVLQPGETTDRIYSFCSGCGKSFASDILKKLHLWQRPSQCTPTSPVQSLLNSTQQASATEKATDLHVSQSKVAGNPPTSITPGVAKEGLIATTNKNQPLPGIERLLKSCYPKPRVRRYKKNVLSVGSGEDEIPIYNKSNFFPRRNRERKSQIRQSESDGPTPKKKCKFEIYFIKATSSQVQSEQPILVAPENSATAVECEVIPVPEPAVSVKQDSTNQQAVPSSVETLACSYCTYQASSPDSLECHRQFHQESWEYSCDRCDYRSITEADLATHTRLKHTVDRSKKVVSQCPTCNIQMPTSAAMVDHMKIHILKSICPTCSFTTSNFCHLAEHHKAHHLPHTNPLKSK